MCEATNDISPLSACALKSMQLNVKAEAFKKGIYCETLSVGKDFCHVDLDIFCTFSPKIVMKTLYE